MKLKTNAAKPLSENTDTDISSDTGKEERNRKIRRTIIYILIAIIVIIICLLLVRCHKDNTTMVKMTDENGDVVTTEITVTGKDGKAVTDKDGKVVTSSIAVTETKAQSKSDSKAASKADKTTTTKATTTTTTTTTTKAKTTAANTSNNKTTAAPANTTKATTKSSYKAAASATPAATQATTQVQTQTVNPNEAATSITKDMLPLMNSARTSAGLPAFVTNSALEQLALRRAQECAEDITNYGATNEAAHKRMVSGIGEDAAGPSSWEDSASGVFNGWMNSPGHKAPIMYDIQTDNNNGGYWDTETNSSAMYSGYAMACAKVKYHGNWYWVAEFAHLDKNGNIITY